MGGCSWRLSSRVRFSYATAFTGHLTRSSLPHTPNTLPSYNRHMPMSTGRELRTSCSPLVSRTETEKDISDTSSTLPRFW